MGEISRALGEGSTLSYQGKTYQLAPWSYGIQAASLTYFGKSAYKLNLAESALLAGLPQSPSQLSPFGHRKAALKRRGPTLAMRHRKRIPV